MLRQDEMRYIIIRNTRAPIRGKILALKQALAPEVCRTKITYSEGLFATRLQLFLGAPTSRWSVTTLSSTAAVNMSRALRPKVLHSQS